MVPALLNKLEPFQNKKQVIIHNQSVGDIMTGILQTHSKYFKEYDKICTSFDGKNADQIARKVFDYLKDHTHYRIEKDNAQTLRSPGAILALGANPRIGLDCKSYALFIAGILAAWQRRGVPINWCYRFASYKLTDKLPHHVFVVLNPNTNNEIFVDPVLPSYNYRKQYTYKIDRKPMSLIAISGVGRTKRTKEEKRKRRLEIKEKIKKQIKQKGKLVLKFAPATVTARNSFLLLVKLNVFNLGRRLFQAQSIAPDKLRKFWETIGGNYRTLSIAIGQGAKKQPQLSGTIGFAPAIAGAIATATPIVVAVKKFLDDAGIKSDDLKKVAGKLVQSAIEKKLDAKADEIASNEEGETPQSLEDSSDMNIPQEAQEALDGGEDSGGDEMGAIPKNMLLLGGGAILAAIFVYS